MAATIAPTLNAEAGQPPVSGGQPGTVPRPRHGGGRPGPGAGEGMRGTAGVRMADVPAMPEMGFAGGVLKPAMAAGDAAPAAWR